MKKYASIAALALRLTWLRVLAVFGAVGFAQWFLVFQEFRKGPCQRAFASVLDEYPQSVCNLGLIALTLVLYFAFCSGKGSKTGYTMRRLRISEKTSTTIFTLVFAGYFILYWTLQLALCFLFYRMYIENMGPGQNLLFVDALRSRHFHHLLPLYEPWGIARNGILILALSGGASLSARNSRNGRSAPLLITIVIGICWVVCYPYNMASRENDIVFIVLALICYGLDRFWSWRWMCNEAD